MLLNESWDAARALEHGLIDRCIPDGQLAAAANTLAQQLAAGPTRAYSETRRLIWNSVTSSLEEQLAGEAASIKRLARTADARNAITAMLAKQRVPFQGK